jgi:DNA helicase IV
MAKRRFQLPREEQLSKEQDRILALPENGQFLVIGGPGTGKSVVALLRAMKYHKPGTGRFLTYNRVLHAATEQLADFFSPGDAMTIHSWFFRTYQKLLNTRNYPPQHKPFDYHYEKIREQINQLPDHRHKTYAFRIIVDEGQDMPVGFYETLIAFGLENFFIVADQNQQITEQNSSRQELTDVLGLEVSDVFELTQNYRNTHPIAALAGHFYTDRSSPPPELPSRPSQSTPVLFEYQHEQDVTQLILREADKDSSKLIGLIVADNSVRKRYVKQLGTLDIDFDHSRPVISTYPDFDDSQGVNITFSHGGVVVLNAASVKGIEFDTVFIVLDGFKVIDEVTMKKRLYVMTSRAIEKLVLLKSLHCPDELNGILPDDETLLRRESLASGQQVSEVSDSIELLEEELPF